MVKQGTKDLCHLRSTIHTTGAAETSRRGGRAPWGSTPAQNTDGDTPVTLPAKLLQPVLAGGEGEGTTSHSCNPPSLSEEVPVALETHLGGQCWQRCWPRRGASESRTAGNGPPPGGHHGHTGEVHPALPAPGRSGPGFPGHGWWEPGSARSLLPVCLSVYLPQGSRAPKCLDLVSPAWLSYLLP